jgi:hypothetical protein
MSDTLWVSSPSVTISRWLARVIGILILTVFWGLVVADFVIKGRIAIGSDRILMAVCLIITSVGLVIAWKREGVGGAIGLVGLLGVNILSPSAARPGIYAVTGLFALPVLILLFCWWRKKKQGVSAAVAETS